MEIEPTNLPTNLPTNRPTYHRCKRTHHSFLPRFPCCNTFTYSPPRSGCLANDKAYCCAFTSWGSWATTMVVAGMPTSEIEDFDLVFGGMGPPPPPPPPPPSPPRYRVGLKRTASRTARPSSSHAAARRNLVDRSWSEMTSETRSSFASARNVAAAVDFDFDFDALCCPFSLFLDPVTPDADDDNTSSRVMICG